MPSLRTSQSQTAPPDVDLCFFLIDLDRTDEALQLYDRRVWGVWKEFCEDQINAVSLLARLELRGVDVGQFPRVARADRRPRLALAADYPWLAQVEGPLLLLPGMAAAACS